MNIKNVIAVGMIISTVASMPIYAEVGNNGADNVTSISTEKDYGTDSVWTEENNDNDRIVSDWDIIGKKTYYYNSKGEKVTGFQKIEGDTYYFDKEGVMQTGWKTISKKKYYFSKKGVMQIGLKKIGKNKYYFLEDGVMSDCGIYKNYIISYTGKCYKIPDKKTGNKTADAKRVAKLIAKCCGANKKGMKDLERVGRAAYAVSGFCSKCKYTMSGPNYSEAYGVFIAKEYSCAGATRALGLVLDCMGYKWKHVNENQYSHQWLTLTMDKKKGYADGMGGFAGYGKYPGSK